MRILFPKATIMLSLYDQSATKKPTNLSINSDLLSKAKKLKINLSATLEHALENQLRISERENWRRNNKNAIESLNNLADKSGLFSDSYRNL
jgi:antitoxin CcdA